MQNLCDRISNFLGVYSNTIPETTMLQRKNNPFTPIHSIHNELSLSDVKTFQYNHFQESDRNTDRVLATPPSAPYLTCFTRDWNLFGILDTAKDRKRNAGKAHSPQKAWPLSALPASSMASSSAWKCHISGIGNVTSTWHQRLHIMLVAAAEAGKTYCPYREDNMATLHRVGRFLEMRSFWINSNKSAPAPS